MQRDDMKSASDELEKLRLLAEKSWIKTDELDKLLAKVESKLHKLKPENFQIKSKVLN